MASSTKRQRTANLTGGGVLAAIGLFLSITSTNPGSLRANIDEYLDPLGGSRSVGLVLLGVVAGAGLGYLMARGGARRTNVLTDAEYRAEFRELVSGGEIVEVSIFGYTGETVLADLLAYEDRYRSLRVRMLHRNWLMEESDEKRHNDRRETSKSRPWKKSAAIRRTATEPWEHTMRREIRYYDGPPQIKGVVLSDGRGPLVAFLSFFKWDATPSEGGSPFKGIPKGIVKLSREEPGEAEVITYAVSQFELMWTTAKPVDAVLKLEKSRRARRARTTADGWGSAEAADSPVGQAE